jgi:hypothetical protein
MVALVVFTRGYIARFKATSKNNIQQCNGTFKTSMKLPAMQKETLAACTVDTAFLHASKGVNKASTTHLAMAPIYQETCNTPAPQVLHYARDAHHFSILTKALSSLHLIHHVPALCYCN